MVRFAFAALIAAAFFATTLTATAKPNGKKPAKGKGGDKVEALFKKLDTNSDGKLSQDEFAKIGEQRKGKGKGGNDGKGQGRFAGGEAFKKLDTNSDGNLSLDEFRKLSELRKNKKGK